MKSVSSSKSINYKSITFAVFVVQRYLIGLNFVGQNFPRTKFFVVAIRNFRHFRPTKNFVHWKIVLFLKSRQWALNGSFTVTFIKKNLDKIFVGINFWSDKIFVTSKTFRHFCPTKFSPIRYCVYKRCSQYS